MRITLLEIIVQSLERIEREIDLCTESVVAGGSENLAGDLLSYSWYFQNVELGCDSKFWTPNLMLKSCRCDLTKPLGVFWALAISQVFKHSVIDEDN